MNDSQNIVNRNDTDANIDDENDIRVSNRIQNLNINDYNSNNHNNKNKISFLIKEINTDLSCENDVDNNKENNDDFVDISYNSVNAEEVFKLQKQKIKTMKEKYKIQKNNYLKSIEYKSGNHNLKSKPIIKISNKIEQHFVSLSLNDINIFETAIFNYNSK